MSDVEFDERYPGLRIALKRAVLDLEAIYERQKESSRLSGSEISLIQSASCKLQDTFRLLGQEVKVGLKVEPVGALE